MNEFSVAIQMILFLHFQLPPEKEPEPDKKIARLAIGVEGGFNPDANKKKFEYEDTNSVVILPAFDVIPLPNPDLPELVSHLYPFLSLQHHVLSCV